MKDRRADRRRDANSFQAIAAPRRSERRSRRRRLASSSSRCRSWQRCSECCWASAASRAWFVGDRKEPGISAESVNVDAGLCDASGSTVDAPWPSAVAPSTPALTLTDSVIPYADADALPRPRRQRIDDLPVAITGRLGRLGLPATSARHSNRRECVRREFFFNTSPAGEFWRCCV